MTQLKQRRRNDAGFANCGVGGQSGGKLVGAWGTGLFADDLACDIRDHYRQLLEDSDDDSAATRLTLEKFKSYLQEADSVALIAFAITQSKVGRLEPDIRDRALAIIAAGADLALWERENPKLLPKRSAALDKA